jgi:hypothetical protein
VLLGIMGLISAAATYSMGLWATVTGISVVSCTLFSVLELFVAFLQAYIFTILASVYIGGAAHPESWQHRNPDKPQFAVCTGSQFIVADFRRPRMKNPVFKRV